jgi:anthranilate 1,2-dioxygenase reductase subunit
MPGPITAELTRRAPIAPGISELWFDMRSPDRLAFRAGQFVSLAVGGGAPSPAIPRRSYSIASQSDAGERLRFIIRVIPQGAASEYLMSLPVGAPVSMTGPHGFFVLDPSHAGDVVFGATGTGIAAVMPMLGELARQPRPAGREPEERQPGRYVYWGVREEADLFARAEIEALADRAGAELRVFLTAPGPAWTGSRGRITPALVESLPEFQTPTFYLVGNGAMITDVKRELVARGVNRKTQIRTEAFFD